MFTSFFFFIYTKGYMRGFSALLCLLANEATATSKDFVNRKTVARNCQAVCLLFFFLFFFCIFSRRVKKHNA